MLAVLSRPTRESGRLFVARRVSPIRPKQIDDQRDEVVRICGLGQERRETGPQRLTFVPRADEGGERDRRYPSTLPLRQLAQSLDQRVTVLPRHREIADQNIGLEGSH